MMQRMTILAACTAIAMLSSCGPAPKLRVNNAVLVLSPVDSNPSALYFTVHGGEQAVRLYSATSPSVIRTEMHESNMDPKTGAMTMAAIKEIPIPAKGTVKFERGGKHVMVWGVNQKARRLGEMETEFLFSNGERILVDTVVQEVDGSVPDERKAVT
jgi:periplasmic copper chaperone A